MYTHTYILVVSQFNVVTLVGGFLFLEQVLLTLDLIS